MAKTNGTTKKMEARNNRTSLLFGVMILGFPISVVIPTVLWDTKLPT
jgi:hypothetical protein